jgi:MFS family permease
MKMPNLFYGYVIVAACFGIQATGVGTHVAFGIFFKPLLADFGWQRATLSGAHSFAFFMSGLLAIFLGRMNDRFGPRLVMTFTGFLAGLGLVCMSRLDAAWQIYLFYGILFGMGLSSVDVISLSTTARWFMRRRGVMTGIVKVGTGAGQLLIPLAASGLIAAYGWRGSYTIIGVLVMLLLIGFGQLLRRDPSYMGALPDGDQQMEATGLGLAERGYSLHEAIRTRQFWTICFANFAIVSCLMTMMLHIVPHTTDLGLPASTAAGILATIGGVSMGGRLGIGIAIDRIGTKACSLICLILFVSAFLWIHLAKESWMLILFAFVYGFGHGGYFTLISPLVAEHFGIRSHGVLFGIVLFAGTTGGGIGPVLAGHIFDSTGSYSAAFWICAAVSTLGFGLLLSLKKSQSGSPGRSEPASHALPSA